MQSSLAKHRRSRSDIVFDSNKLGLSRETHCDYTTNDNVPEVVTPLTSLSLSHKISSHILHKHTPKSTPNSPRRNISLFRTPSHKDFGDTTFNHGNHLNEFSFYGSIHKSSSVSSLKRLNPMNFIRRKSNPSGYLDFMASPKDSSALDAGIIYGTRTHEWGGVSSSSTIFSSPTPITAPEKSPNDYNPVGMRIENSLVSNPKGDSLSIDIVSSHLSPQKRSQERSLEILEEEDREDSQSNIEIPDFTHLQEFNSKTVNIEEEYDLAGHVGDERDDMRSLFSFEKYNLERNSSLTNHEDVELELEKEGFVTRQKKNLQEIDDYSKSFFQGYEDEFDGLADAEDFDYDYNCEDDEFEETGRLFNIEPKPLFFNIDKSSPLLQRNSINLSETPVESSLEPALSFNESKHFHADREDIFASSKGKYEFIFQDSSDTEKTNLNYSDDSLDNDSAQDSYSYNNVNEYEYHNDLSYDGLLDEVNEIPAEFDGDDFSLLSRKGSQSSSLRSKPSLKRSHSHLQKPRKGNGVVTVAIPQKNSQLKLPSTNVTVTLFTPNQPSNSDNSMAQEIRKTRHEILAQDAETFKILDLLHISELEGESHGPVSPPISNFENKVGYIFDSSDKSDLAVDLLSELPKPRLPRRGSLTPISERSYGSDYTTSPPFLVLPHPP
ncbi:hypothetical protein NADFUDRAFT_78131 [Nadsonia fulvescens var. elongata DSM 6958]|uniref:Uncharacterized protein n=1 Tax=Nadsonia fulvescens var. elongata DSM 6958 TaxID=857566 RepID=A0A1E3PMW3_9ASCO|nr:hypothetical protein NADFUDRAFT_78131 [Nadsonia fulvescens var. elongata DSM 6958]